MQSFHPEGKPAGQSQGALTWHDKELAEIDPAYRLEKICCLFGAETSHLTFSTVREELAFVMENLVWSPPRMQMRLAEVCRYFSLTDILDAPLDTLSGGQLQVVQLAAMLMTAPDILVVDEPLSQLDPVMRDQWLRLLKKMQQETNLTLLVSGHEPALMAWCDRVVYLKEGHLDFQGTPAQAAAYFYRQPDTCALVPDLAQLALHLGQDQEKLPFSVQDAQSLLAFSVVCRTDPPKTLATEVALDMRHVVYAYSDDRMLLRDVSLQLQAGERFYLLGGNGSGKSTCLRLAAGHYLPLEGRIRRSTEKRKGKKQSPFPYLSQFPQAYFTAFSVVEMAKGVYQRLSDSDRSRAELIYDTLSLRGLAAQHPLDLSQGEQQRLALFLVLSQPSEVYVLDEPTKGLDAAGVATLQELLESPMMRHKTVLMCGHDLTFAGRCADRAAFLFDGMITEPMAVLAFLAQNAFYTTDLHRLYAAQQPDIVLPEQVVVTMS